MAFLVSREGPGLGPWGVGSRGVHLLAEPGPHGSPDQSLRGRVWEADSLPHALWTVLQNR